MATIGKRDVGVGGLAPGMSPIELGQDGQEEMDMMTIFPPRSKPELSKQEPFEWCIPSCHPQR